MQPFTRVTEDEYLARERSAETKHELINGQMVAMAGARPRHNAIVANLVVALGARLRGSGCRPLGSDQRIYVPATGLYTYPDVSIVCGEPALHPKDDLTITNPRVLFEVLSEGTEAYDRGAKFGHYRSIASLETYVMVTQGEARAERYDRLQEGWHLVEAVGGDAVLELRTVQISIPLSELYVDLPSD